MSKSPIRLYVVPAAACAAAVAGRAATGSAPGRHLLRFGGCGAALAAAGLFLIAPSRIAFFRAPEPAFAAARNPFPRLGAAVSSALPPEAALAPQTPSLGLADALGPAPALPEEEREEAPAELAASPRRGAGEDGFDWSQALAIARGYRGAQEPGPRGDDSPEAWIRAARLNRDRRFNGAGRPESRDPGVRERGAATSERGEPMRGAPTRGVLAALRGGVHPEGLRPHSIRRVRAKKAAGQLRAARDLTRLGLGSGATEEEAAQSVHDAFDQQLFRGARLAPGSGVGGEARGGPCGAVRLPQDAAGRPPFIAPVGEAR